MKNCVIIGAGQLGSRHLQGLLKSQISLNVFVIDPELKSLQLAKERAEAISHSHNIEYYENISLLPKHLHFVIIATNSNIRENIIEQLIPFYEIEYLILEKVLFQSLEAYDRISSLIEKCRTKVFVNHTRRMFSHYKDLRNHLNSDGRRTYTVFGSNWGLACNGLHFIDLFCFLSNSHVRALNTDSLDNEILESKRPGYFEFTGILTGELDNGDFFAIGSLKDGCMPITLTINDLSQQRIIREGNSTEILELNKDHVSKLYSIQNGDSLFQSSLTEQLCNRLFLENQIDLPTYEEAKLSHVPFIRSLLAFYNNINNSNMKKLPIT